MKLLDRLATILDVIGIPTGRFSPGNFIADVAYSFVQADELEAHGIAIPRRTLSTARFVEITSRYLGYDLASDVLDAVAFKNVTVRAQAIFTIRSILERREDREARQELEEIVQKVTTDILDAQKRFGS